MKRSSSNDYAMRCDFIDVLRRWGIIRRDTALESYSTAAGLLVDAWRGLR